MVRKREKKTCSKSPRLIEMDLAKVTVNIQLTRLALIDLEMV